MEINITIPALLFSAISLLVLAFTNRFLSLAQLVRSLHDQYKQNPNKNIFEQIRNLRKRLHLIKITQIAGLSSLLLCVVSMFLIYINLHLIAEMLFGVALVSLSTSLALSIWEIQISVHALNLHLDDMENK
jgi:hypothetical protein